MSATMSVTMSVKKSLKMPSPFRRLLRPSIAWFMIPSALVVWFLFVQIHVSEWPLFRGGPELSPYSISVDSVRSQRWTRGEDPILGVRWSEKFSLLLRPGAPVQLPVTLRVFRGRDGSLQRWGAPFVPLNDGGFLLNTRPADLPELGRGPWELVFLIGRPGALPANPFVLPDGPGGVGWQVLRLQLSVEGDPPV